MVQRGLFIAAVFGVFAVGRGDSGGQMEKPPGNLAQINTNRPPPGKPWTVIIELGDMAQISAYCRANDDGENLRSLRVELGGDSMTQVGGILEVPVWEEPSPAKKPGGTTAVKSGKILDKAKKHLCFFLKSVRPGDTAVKVTPVGVDGKARPTRELIIQVRERVPDRGKVNKSPGGDR